jgi:hypothetical protein
MLAGAVTGTVIGPETVSITATPRVIQAGDSVTVSWETHGVESVAMEWGPEYHRLGSMQMRTGLPPSGKMTDKPQEDSVYVLECETASGQVCASASATVRVKGAVHTTASARVH